MFRTHSVSIIRRSIKLTAYATSGTVTVSWSCSKAVYKPVWHIPLLNVQWITPDDGQRNYLKHVEFHFQNKFQKLVHLVGFIIWKFIAMHGHMNVKFSHSFWFFIHFWQEDERVCWALFNSSDNNHTSLHITSHVQSHFCYYNSALFPVLHHEMM
jgi:hypothetical protein